MGNPKFIQTQKKVTYSFRVEEDNLNKLRQISELNNIKLPKLMSNIINDYLKEKIVYNDYLEDFEGIFINLPDITQGKSYDEYTDMEYYLSDLSFEYEVKKIPNNLDVWSPTCFSYNSPSKHYSHEGIEFLIVPEICEYENRQYYDLTKYLYCIYFTVGENKSQVELTYISFLEAINKIKMSENYLLLNFALKLKNTLEERSEMLEQKFSQVEDNKEDFEYIWTELDRISNEFNSGNIIPIDKSRKEIQNKASLQSMTNLEKENLLKQNEILKKELKKMDSILERLNEVEKNNKDLENKVLGDIDEETLEKLKKLLK